MAWMLDGTRVVRTDGALVRQCSSVESAAEYLASLEANLWFEKAKKFDAATRKKLASSGAALPDGSFPIEDVEDLHNAIHAIGRANDPEAVKAHIKKRADALGATSSLPASY